MESEGRGIRAPAPRLLRVEPGVVGECVAWAKACADYRGYSSRSDAWGKGICQAVTLLGGYPTEQSYTGTAIGKVAEWYAASLFGVEIDLDFSPSGDGGVDLLLPCGRSQVKNSTRIRPMLVKVGSQELRSCEWFIATKWNGTEECVSVLGYTSKGRVLASEVVDGIGRWKNFSVELRDLFPISGLLSIKPVSEVL
jgi:hypothetical protein